MRAVDCPKILKALSDLNRLRIVKALLGVDQTVNELTAKLNLSQYNASRHLRVLRDAGIVDVRVIGQHREYFVNPTARRRVVREGVVLDFGFCMLRMSQLPD